MIESIKTKLWDLLKELDVPSLSINMIFEGFKSHE
jgi:hypothetical protein